MNPLWRLTETAKALFSMKGDYDEACQVNQHA
jgi:hypothetical protein